MQHEKWIHAAVALVLSGTPVSAAGRKAMSSAAPVALELKADGAHDIELKSLGPGAWEIRTTGSDPYVFTKTLTPPVTAKRRHVLSFEFFCPSGTDSFQVFFGPTLSEARSLQAPGLGVAEGWIKHSVDLALSPAWKEKIPFLRLDFGKRTGRTIRIRHLELRTPNARELELAVRRAEKQDAEKKLDRDLERYFDREYPCRVTRVAVSPEQVRVSFRLGNETADGVYLCEVPLYQNVTELRDFVFTAPVTRPSTTMILPRYRTESTRTHDRLLSQWVLARKTANGFELLSHARYTDDDAIEGARSLPVLHPRSKKGIGGFSPARFDNGSDADAFGIGYVTVNIILSFMRPGPGKNTLPFTYCGHTYYVDKGHIAGYDRTLRFCAKRGITAFAIILIPKAGGFAGNLGRFFMHPDCDPQGIYSMANLTSPQGLDYYAAALDFLAERYSREDGRYGRIQYWIVHNEVDAGWVWTNAGHKPLRVFLELYEKSMRVVHLIARKYDRNAAAFISLTHHWTWTYDKRFYQPKTMLELLAHWSKVEGDFEWGVAYHPYPQSLRNPRCWEDDKVDFTFNTPLITFKNIEVLAAWVAQPFMKYREKVRRKVHLSEQGPNSPDYSEKSLRDQAACMAYAWKKIEILDAIDGFEYHNWIDNPHEGGLRLGLRMFPGKEFKCAPKPIWFVYKALETTEEDAACEFAKKVIGIRNWTEVRHTAPIR